MSTGDPQKDLVPWYREVTGYQWLVLALASAGCGVASNIHQLIIARSVQGVGSALLVPGSLAIISASFDEKSRGPAIGTWSGFTAITTAIGPVFGGWLVEHASWRWVFFLNLPIAAAVVAISLWRIPESRSASAERIDWPGAILSTLGLWNWVIGCVESLNLGWGNPLVFESLTIGAGCLIAFVFVEAASTSPMLPLTLFKSRSFSGANLLTLLLYAAIGIFFVLIPLEPDPSPGIFHHLQPALRFFPLSCLSSFFLAGLADLLPAMVHGLR